MHSQFQQGCMRVHVRSDAILGSPRESGSIDGIACDMHEGHSITIFAWPCMYPHAIFDTTSRLLVKF